jgi:hypothetical protein
MVVRIFGQSHIILSTVQPNNKSGKTMKMEGYYYLCIGTKSQAMSPMAERIIQTGTTARKRWFIVFGGRADLFF